MQSEGRLTDVARRSAGMRLLLSAFATVTPTSIPHKDPFLQICNRAQMDSTRPHFVNVRPAEGLLALRGALTSGVASTDKLPSTRLERRWRESAAQYREGAVSPRRFDVRASGPRMFSHYAFSTCAGDDLPRHQAYRLASRR